jgi:hypothetical protein
MRLLSLGCATGADVVQRLLNQLHRGEHGPIEALLVDQSHATDADVYCWSTHRTHATCAVHRWPGSYAAHCGLRPAVTGVDRIRSMLIEAWGHADRVIVWGAQPAFGADGKRRRDWDVAQGVVVGEALNLGWSGWAVEDGALRNLV